MAFAIVLIVSLDSCSMGRKIPYFQNIDTVSLKPSKGLYDARIMPKDILKITVRTVNEEASYPFNNSFSQTNAVQDGITNYLVSNEGFINFPVVGRLQVVGLTKTECQNLILEKIRPYLSEAEKPIVEVRQAAFTVTVIGEVEGSKVISVEKEKISIIEALAQAGDMTIYGRRDNILLIREDVYGEKHMARLNINDANIINSPYYYLQQNDVIYIEPNKIKRNNASISSSTSTYFSFISSLFGTVSLVIALTKL